MEELNLVTIYWLISIGLLVGFAMDLIMFKRGVGLIGNIAGGVIGSVVIGVLLIMLGMYAPLIYAALGAVVFLFLVNVFSFHPSDAVDVKTE